MNKVILTGNVGKAETRQVGDKQVLKFTLATQESYKDKNTNEWQTITDWHNVTVWNPTEYQNKNIGKGVRIGIEGKLKHNSYEKDGEKRMFTEIIPNIIEIYNVPQVTQQQPTQHQQRTTPIAQPLENPPYDDLDELPF